MSVDLWIEKTAAHAKIILVRILGGYDRWSYGVEELSRMARAKKIALALLPGECSIRDERLAGASTVSEDELSAILACFREGGPDNMRLLARRLATLAAGKADILPTAAPMSKAGYYKPGKGIVEATDLLAGFAPDAPRLPILFYRSMLLANDAAPIDALFDALARRGFAPMPIFVSGLKDSDAVAFVEQAIFDLKPAAILSTTAFASGSDENGETIFDRAGVPVFQVVIATTRREGWAENRRGLNPADLAMHVVLPEPGRAYSGRRGLLQGGRKFRQSRQPAGAGPDRTSRRPDRRVPATEGGTAA